MFREHWQLDYRTTRKHWQYRIEFYHKMFYFFDLSKSQSIFLQNEDIFVQLDELDELDRITHAWIGFHYSLIETQKTF